MFNNNARDSAALDRHITGESDYSKTPVTAKCDMNHTWDTHEVRDMGCTELLKPECPTCKRDAATWWTRERE